MHNKHTGLGRMITQNSIWPAGSKASSLRPGQTVDCTRCKAPSGWGFRCWTMIDGLHRKSMPGSPQLQRGRRCLETRWWMDSIGPLADGFEHRQVHRPCHSEREKKNKMITKKTSIFTVDLIRWFAKPRAVYWAVFPEPEELVNAQYDNIQLHSHHHTHFACD